MIYHIYANQTNIGDWVSAKGIQSVFVGLELEEHFCDGPWIEQSLAVIANAGPRDLVIIGGGGLLMNYFDNFWTGLAEFDVLPPLVIWGPGVCDLKQEASVGLVPAIRKVFEQARHVSVRDHSTRELVGMDLTPEPLICPSVLAIAPEPITRRGVLHVDNYNAVGGEIFEFMNETCRAFASQTDRPFARTNNRIDRGSADQLVTCLDNYRAADVIVSSGLHGCIIGAAMGRKVVAVSGDYKVDGFMQAVGLEDWCLDYRDAKRLPERLDQIDQQPSVADRMEQVRAANRTFGQTVRALCVDQTTQYS